MQDDENTQDLELEQKDEETDVEETQSTTEAEEPEKEEQPKEEKVTLSPAELRHFRKWQKEKSQATEEPAQKSQTASSQPNVEETVLLAQGMPEEVLTQLKKVATINNTSLLKAQNDPIFVAIKEKFEKDQRHKDASLGASRGASTVKAKKDFATPALSREEHMKMVKDTL